MPEPAQGFVPAEEQAHVQGLRVIWEAAKLLDMVILDLVDASRDRNIEIAGRGNNLPCFSLPARDAHRPSRHAEAR